MIRTIVIIAFVCIFFSCMPYPLAADSVINKFADTLQSSVKPSLKTCQSQTGATKADLESLKMRKVPRTKTGRCFLQCLFNSVKLMDDGKFSKQGMIIAFSAAMKGDLSKIGKLRKLSEVCEKEIGGKKYENCEVVQKIVECVAKNGQAYGIEFKHDKM
ncbi:uncharacterized protein LOC108910209 [Anoplophora glabripennis]|uniref:uncharacterized protein LOC108910209 n=1 Tax=Anoplophora glabripennis TaxID=217634 RepID=UPI0008738BE8|nr:uncharacterized protein LOC108910209 [Anoplophora glabripennis]